MLNLIRFCICLFCIAVVHADDLAVVAERGGVAVTLQDIDTAVEKIPASERAAVLAGADRLNQILDTELLNKQMVVRARDMGLEELPEVQRRLARARDQELAKIVVEKVVESAKKQDFDLLANEYYLANTSEFTVPKTSVVQHILVSRQGRSASEILIRINEILEKLSEPGASFEELITEFSDDASKSESFGQMSVSEPGLLVKPFEDAAHALEKPGDVSLPIETEFGTHILRLVSRVEVKIAPFDSVKEEIISKLENEYLSSVRGKFFSDLRAASPVFHEDMLEVVRKRYGEVPDLRAQRAAEAQNTK